jgi:hypothetical protein
MGEEAVETVRRAVDLLNESLQSGEASHGLLDLCEKDIEVDASRRVFNPEVYDGHAGMQRLVREI